MEESMEARKVDPPRLPRIGEPAPGFEAETTLGTIRLEDFKGSWLILFSHPADFTPVCTTEFVAFAEIQEELRKLGVELMGLSIDSGYAHIAWIRNMEEKFGIKSSITNKDDEGSNFTLVIESEELKIGILVSEVPNTFSVATSEIEEAANVIHNSSMDQNYITGIVKI